MKVNKPRMSLRKIVPSNPSSRMKSVLPVLIKLQNIEECTPNEIMDILGYITNKDSYRLLTPVEKSRLIAYLKKYGYNSEWMEEKNEKGAGY